jgi:small subunit ribosomal protein S13
MARIAGIDLPKNKRGEIGLTYIFGIGRSTSQKILTSCGISWDKKVSEWNDEELNAIRKHITEGLTIEGELRSERQLNIKRLLEDYVTVKVYLFADNVLVPILEQEKVNVKQLQVKRK